MMIQSLGGGGSDEILIFTHSKHTSVPHTHFQWTWTSDIVLVWINAFEWLKNSKILPWYRGYPNSQKYQNICFQNFFDFCIFRLKPKNSLPIISAHGYKLSFQPGWSDQCRVISFNLLDRDMIFIFSTILSSIHLPMLSHWYITEVYWIVCEAQ